MCPRAAPDMPEPAVDDLLDPVAGRLEHRRHGQGGGRHDQGGITAQQLAQPEDHQGIACAQQREQAVGEGAAEAADKEPSGPHQRANDDGEGGLVGDP